MLKFIQVNQFKIYFFLILMVLSFLTGRYSLKNLKEEIIKKDFTNMKVEQKKTEEKSIIKNDSDNVVFVQKFYNSQGFLIKETSIESHKTLALTNSDIQTYLEKNENNHFSQETKKYYNNQNFLLSLYYPISLSENFILEKLDYQKVYVGVSVGLIGNIYASAMTNLTFNQYLLGATLAL